MCLACEQEAMWYAYLQRRGLITPDGRFVEPPQQEVNKEGAPEPANKTALSFDDPTAG